MERSLVVGLGVIISVGVAIIMALVDGTKATKFTVGDGIKWVEPPTLTTYSIWASSHLFVKGDLLVFIFNTGIHNVAEVTKEEYNQCKTTSFGISIHTQSPVTVHLNTSGWKYFISTLDNDCQNGQKLAIKVLHLLPPSPPPSLPPGPPLATAPTTITTPPQPLQNSTPPCFALDSLVSVIISLVIVFICLVIL